MEIYRFVGLAFFLAAFSASTAVSAELAPYEITIKEHQFSPTEIEIPADTKVKLLIKNLDATPEEFESHELNREKIIKGNSEATILLGPLKPGRYPFVGEFHEDTAKGTLIVK